MTDLPVGEVICGDALEVMRGWPGGCFDAFLIDPPWGIDGGIGTGALRGKGNYSNDFEDNRRFIEEVVVPIVGECLRVARRGAVTPGNRWMQLYPLAQDIGCFYSPASVGRGPWGWNNHSPILYYGQDPNAGNGSYPTSRTMNEAPPPRGIVHPCPKPIAPWRWLLEKVSKPGDVVLDCFCGSGTTLVACVQTGRRFVGIDISEDYCAVARCRVAEALAQPRLDFGEAQKKPRQEGMEL